MLSFSRNVSKLYVTTFIAFANSHLFWNSNCIWDSIEYGDCVTAPALRLPLDEIQSATVKGSISGNVSVGVVLVQGKLGNALSVNDINEAVNFGKHPSKCFYNPDACTVGSTFSYWLKWKSASSESLLMDSGGYYTSARGYAHELKADGRMIVYIKTLSSYYILGASINDPEKWAFLYNRGPQLLESNSIWMVALYQPKRTNGFDQLPSHGV